MEKSSAKHLVAVKSKKPKKPQARSKKVDKAMLDKAKELLEESTYHKACAAAATANANKVMADALRAGGFSLQSPVCSTCGITAIPGGRVDCRCEPPPKQAS